MLATGGGAFMDADTRALIAAKGVSVWLKADLEVLLRRTKRRNERPLRRPDARRCCRSASRSTPQADLTVQSREEPHDAIVEEIDRRRWPASSASAGAQQP